MAKKGGKSVNKTVVTTTTTESKGTPKKRKYTKRKNTKRKTTRKSPAKKKTTTTTKTDESVPKVLIENFVALQRVLADLSGKLNDLTNQTSKLLDLFEQSAKTLMEKDVNLDGGKEEKEVVEKLDKLLDQNKVLAQGISLLHESAPQEEPEEQEPPPNKITQAAHPGTPPMMQQQPGMPQKVMQQDNMNKYQRSISSKY